MSILIAHRSVAGVYLCHEKGQSFWGPREQARIYSGAMATALLQSFPHWEYYLGVHQDEAVIEMDNTHETDPPPKCRVCRV